MANHAVAAEFWELGAITALDGGIALDVDAVRRLDGQRAISLALREVVTGGAPEIMIGHFDEAAVRRLRDTLERWLAAGGDVQRLIAEQG